MSTATDRRIVIPDLQHGEQNELDELLAQWRQKRKRNNLRAGFYDMKNGVRHLMSSNAPAVVKRKKFVMGWSAIAVDKLNRRCNIDGFFDAAGTNLSNLGLAELERSNQLRSELSQAGVSSLLHAVSWLVTVRGDTEAGEPEVLILPRPATEATGFWDSRRRGLRSFLSITDQDERGEPIAMTMYLFNLNVIMTKRGGKWVVERRSHSDGLPVDPLRYQPRLGRPFGSSRLSRAVMSYHEQALGVMIRADVNGEAYSLPRYALLGATEESFRNADGSQKPTWLAAWDAMWAIGDDEDLADAGSPLARADIKQFHGQSPEPQNAHLRMLAQMLSGETGIPIGELGLIGDANPTSAEALTVSKDDLIAEAERTTDDWTPDLSAAMTRALKMLNGGDAPADLNVRPVWRNPMHVSRAAAADATTKVIDKFPWLADTEVGLELAGLSETQIRRALAERRRSSGRSLLQQIADRRAPDDDASQ